MPEFKASGFEALIRAIERIIKGLDDGITKEIQTVGDNIISDARAVVPVRTGRLFASLEVQDVRKDGITLGSDVEYAPFVEYGTVKQRAQPYLRPAILKNISRLKELIGDLIIRNV